MEKYDKNYRIPKEILNVLEEKFSKDLSYPLEDLLKYVYENEVMIYEWPRRKVGRSINVNDDIVGRYLEDVIKFLEGYKNVKNAYLDISVGDLCLYYPEEETCYEWANRLYYTVFKSVDNLFKRAENRHADLLEEKKKIEKRLKEINSLIHE